MEDTGVLAFITSAWLVDGEDIVGVALANVQLTEGSVAPHAVVCSTVDQLWDAGWIERETSPLGQRSPGIGLPTVTSVDVIEQTWARPALTPSAWEEYPTVWAIELAHFFCFKNHFTQSSVSSGIYGVSLFFLLRPQKWNKLPV